jgi:hypothetical protein
MRMYSLFVPTPKVNNISGISATGCIVQSDQALLAKSGLSQDDHHVTVPLYNKHFIVQTRVVPA